MSLTRDHQKIQNEQEKDEIILQHLLEIHFFCAVKLWWGVQGRHDPWLNKRNRQIIFENQKHPVIVGLINKDGSLHNQIN